MDQQPQINLEDYSQFINLTRRNGLWPNSSGKLVTITSMSLQYIKHCIAKIKQDLWRCEYLPIFTAELQRRIDEKQFELTNLAANIGDIDMIGETNMYTMTARSDLKKYIKLNGHSAQAHSQGSFKKYLSMRFKISEYELNKAVSSGKIRIYVS